jgi:hypothetical protein
MSPQAGEDGASAHGARALTPVQRCLREHSVNRQGEAGHSRTASGIADHAGREHPFGVKRFGFLSCILLGLGTQWGDAAAGELGIAGDRESIRLTLSGEDGKEYTLETVEALLNAGALWRPIATVKPGTGPVFLYDPTCSTRPQSFYRLRLLQGAIPVEVPNFRLIDNAGQAQELFYQSDARAVVLILAGKDLSSIAPVAGSLRDLQNRDPAMVRLWVLVARSAAERAITQAELSGLGLEVKVLEDEGGAVTRQLGRGIVPEAVVIDPALYSIVYRGRIVDEVTEPENGPVEHALLDEALEQHLRGDPIVIRATEPVGSETGLPPLAERDYAHDVAPLLQERCGNCHRPGGIAPWAMTNHAIVQNFAPLMKDELLSRRMPPWHADRHVQSYSNDQMLSGEELALIVDWIDRGAPRGGGPDPLAAEPLPPVPDWPLGTPDRTVGIEPQTIPAAGTVDYRYLLVPNPYPSDVWLRAAVVKPGNPRVVHHVLVFSASDINDILEIQGGLGGYFAAYVPGMEQVSFPQDTGKLLKKGSFLVFQLHYTATGQPETDTTELGLYLAPAPPAHELRTSAAYNLQFSIPPGDSNYSVTAEYRMPRNGMLYELSPHMHYRGKWFRFDAIFPDGNRETILNVPFYRFDWQTLYRLSEPKYLPAGTRILVSGGWDNSARNPYNPDPGARVFFGEQSWEEMFIGYFNWSEAP